MTGRLYGYVCDTCGLLVVEVAPVGRCPVCQYYGRPGYLVEIEERGVVMPVLVERALSEPLPPVRRPVKPAVPTKMARPSILDRLKGKMG